MSIISDVDIHNLIIPFLSRIQSIEDMLVYLAWNSRLDVATGAADSDGNWLGVLDKLGAIAGEPRLSRNDTDYRTAIKLRRILNRANGTPEDAYAALQSIGSPTVKRVIENGDASCTLFTNANHTFSTGETQSIRRICPIAVSVNIINQYNTPFVFKEYGASDPTYGLGFGEGVPVAGGGALGELLL